MYQMWRWKVFQSRNLSKDTKLLAFRTLVMSTILYGAETWPVTQQEIRKLRTLHMRCLRDILEFTLWDRRRNADILKETGELPIEEQLRKKRLQWFGRVRRMPKEHPQKQLLKCRPKGKRRPQGGAPLRWIDTVNKDLAKLTNWQGVVKDRAAWRAVIHRS